MEKPFRLTFSNGLTAQVVQVDPSVELSDTLHAMGLYGPRPTLVLVGGASKMSGDDLIRLRSLFIEVLAPLAETLGTFVVDGGTDAGVMRLMGQARAETGATFPLVGVAPTGKVALPDASLSSPGATQLEPHHTHFVLVPGCNWGDESPWLAQVANVLANGAPSVTVLIGGGEVAWEDVLQNVKVGRSVITIAGSGRTADTLAVALRGEVTDKRAKALAESKLVQAINLWESSTRLAKTIKEMLSGKECE